MNPGSTRNAADSDEYLWNGTSLAPGYEYYQLEREFVTWNVNPVPFAVLAQIQLRGRSPMIETPMVGVEYLESSIAVRLISPSRSS
jgi:hypothetical protein